MQIFQILMGGMNFRERSQKNQTSLAVRSALVWGFDFAALFLNLTGGYNVKQRSVPWWCACRSRGCHLGISVKPISSRRGRLCPPHYYRHPRISDLSTALDGVPVVLWCKHRGGPNEHPGDSSTMYGQQLWSDPGPRMRGPNVLPIQIPLRLKL